MICEVDLFEDHIQTLETLHGVNPVQDLWPVRKGITRLFQIVGEEEWSLWCRDGWLLEDPFFPLTPTDEGVVLVCLVRIASDQGGLRV